MDGAVKVEIGRDGIDAGLERLGGLVSGSGAEIEKRVARLEPQQRNYRLRPDILDAPAARVSLGPHERRARDIACSLAAVALFPAREKPFGTRQLDLARRP